MSGVNGPNGLLPMKLRSGRHLLVREPLAKKAKLAASLMPFFPLDDPVLDGIKCHLNIGARIGFDPVSQRFARIAFRVKNRMEMKMVGFTNIHEWPKNPSLQLMVKRKNDANEVPFDITINDMENVLHSLVLRISKWHSVDFAWKLCPNILQDLIIGQLLDAIVAESRPTIDIRRFCCCLVNEQQEKLAEFLYRSAPVLRCLSLVPRNDTELLPLLVQAISACHELRRLAIGSSGTADEFPPSFFPTLQGLEKLNGLHIIHFFRVGPFMASRNSLSISPEWLPHFAQPAFHPLLKKIKRLDVKEQWEDLLPVADLTTILSKMRSPARVVISRGDIDWPDIWNDFLPLVHSTRANVLLNLHFGLPVVTAEEFAADLSTLPAIMQTSLIAPDLGNAQLQDNHYLELEFRFPNNGQLTVRG